MTDKQRTSQEALRDMAHSGDTNLVEVQCTGIERAIPPKSKHESAIKAREYCAQARQFGITEKGFLFLMLAESARKDFELYDDAVKHDASKKGTETAKKNRADKYAADQENWRTTAKEVLAGRTRKPGQRELARLVAAKLDPLLSQDEIVKLADSRRRWIADLL